jgi:hypothetical protein
MGSMDPSSLSMRFRSGSSARYKYDIDNIAEGQRANPIQLIRITNAKMAGGF